MSWKPEVLVQNQWSTNGLRFATEREAHDNASNLMSRWMLVCDFRAAQSDDPVTHIWKDGALFAADDPNGVGYVAPARVSL